MFDETSERFAALPFVRREFPCFAICRHDYKFSLSRNLRRRRQETNATIVKKTAPGFHNGQSS